MVCSVVSFGGLLGGQSVIHWLVQSVVSLGGLLSGSVSYTLVCLVGGLFLWFARWSL